MPLKASSGHWAITAWFLHFTMRRSVATHSPGLQAPALDVPRLVLQGAGHYETGCRPCHGSVDLPLPRIAQQMTPPPPYLPPRITTWEPEELFYIVKHGVKFTGMPAWPSQQRDDEVWAMVAFLLMRPVATRLTPQQMRDVALYYASLPPYQDGLP
jgi:mono/diheme cytochrome c family protein